MVSLRPVQAYFTGSRTEKLLPVNAGSISYHRQAGSSCKHMLKGQFDICFTCCRVSSLHSRSLWQVHIELVTTARLDCTVVSP